jgi:hypothetical protein
VERFHAKLQNCNIYIPTFVIKLVSFLSLIRRSNGDEYHFYQEVEFMDDDGNTTKVFVDSFEYFKIYSEQMRSLMLNFDWVNTFHQLGSRFKSNSDLFQKINNFFDVIKNSSDFDEVLLHFIEFLNQISKCSKEINSSPANLLFEWVILQKQDSRSYGPRNYRIINNEMYFHNALDVNILFALISAVFINSVHSLTGTGTFVSLMTGGIHDNRVCFDVVSPRIFETYFSYILKHLNTDNSNSSSSSNNNNKRKRFLNKKNKNYETSVSNTSVLNSDLINKNKINSEPPSGARGYSSNKTEKYKITFQKNNIDYTLYFPSLDEMKFFFVSEIKNI